MRIQTTSLLLTSSFGYGLKIVSGSVEASIKTSYLSSGSFDKYPRELAKDMVLEKLGLIESTLAQEEEETDLHENTFVAEALEASGSMDPKMILQSPVCESFVTEILVNTKKLVGFGEETILDIFCSDSDREAVSSEIKGKINGMVKDVLFGDPESCREAYEMMKIGQMQFITQALSDKDSCETEVNKELANLHQLGDESGERGSFWFTAASIAIPIVIGWF